VEGEVAGLVVECQVEEEIAVDGKNHLHDIF
jgi:hypothetical protein